jgi:hypothetical protein
MRRTLTVLALLALCACGGPAAEGRLAQYSGRAAELFDDVIEPRAVGLELDVASTPRSDPTLRERTQVGDAVVRVRIDTVTAFGYGGKMRHQLVFQTLEKLAGERPPPPTFTVTMEDESPSAGIVRNLESRLGGKSFIAFVRAFGAAGSAEGGEKQYHFHLAPDSKDVRDAVAEAVVFAAFQK